MIDVIVIGGGRTGEAIAKQLLESGLSVTVVDTERAVPADWLGEWFFGKAIISRDGLVGILDPQTGDERRLLQTKAIVIAAGSLDPANLPAMMFGASKFGVQLTPDKTTFHCNSRGETGAAGIFVTGGCASEPTPGLADSVIIYCTTTLAERSI